MGKRRFAPLTLAAVAGILILIAPAWAQAQSAIAGVVKDTSGAVMPGVTVEASSPALIEKVRSVVTDSQGQYRIVDLRPGTYALTFTLTGFSIVKREGLVLESNFTATVNADLKVGSIEEAITVSGDTPIVDLENTQRRDVLKREMLEALPAQRSWATNTVPAVARATDVGGSNSNAHATLNVYGSNDGQDILVDGVSVMTTGKNPGMYYNYDANEEVVYQVAGGSAEATVGGVSVNMIPRQGGNEFKGDALALFANSSFQGSNYSEELKAKGLQNPPGLVKLWDLNASLGGRIIRDRLWFFFSYRDWGNNKYLANTFNPDGSQGIDDNHLYGSTTRLTYQLSSKNRISAYVDRLGKTQSRRGFSPGYSPEAAYYSVAPHPINAIIKWTAPVSNKLLVEATYGGAWFDREGHYQPEVEKPSQSNPFGGIAKRDLITGRTWNATPGGPLFSKYRSFHINSSVSYVTGSHSFKVGETWAGGYNGNGVQGYNHGDILQQYQNGVPSSVVVYNTPSTPRTDIELDLALFVQDSWKLDRLTLNPGLRYDRFITGFPEQNQPAGRFVGARNFAAVSPLFTWTDLSPRVGAAYDLFGNGSTAIKASTGKYVQFDQTVLAATFNPLVQSSDLRTWNDLNRDDIAQEIEIGPQTNSSFGVRRSINPAPGLQRPYSWFTQVAVQRQLWPNAGLSISYNRRDYRRLLYTHNLAAPVEAYTAVTIPDPRGNGQTLPVYNLNAANRGLVNEVVANSDQNKRIYNGIDLSLNARVRGSTVTISSSTGRIQNVTCQVGDPNALRFCDETEYDVPFITSARVVWITPLPYGFRVSGVFQSTPGGTAGAPEYRQTYLVNRVQIPTLTQANVTVPLTEPGSLNYSQINQFDTVLSKRFRSGRVSLEPRIELFNLFNVAPVLTQVNAFGSSYGTPNDILPGRIARVMMQVKF